MHRQASTGWNGVGDDGCRGSSSDGHGMLFRSARLMVRQRSLEQPKEAN